MEDMVKDDYRRIWRFYREKIFPTSMILREGHMIYEGYEKKHDAIAKDAYDKFIKATFLERFESVAEHSYHTALLTMACLEGHVGCTLFNTCSEDMTTAKTYQLRNLVVSYQLLHDIGMLKTGCPQRDGRPVARKETIAQYEGYEDVVDFLFADGFEREDKQTLMEWRKCNYYATDEDDSIGVLLMAIGDLETVLKIAALELYGLTGDVTKKAEESEAIRNTMEITGTSDALDNFVAYFKMITTGLLKNSNKEVLYGILKAAVMEVRGCWYDWWNEI